jgi:hypothetical protein
MTKPQLYSELYKLGEEVLKNNNPCKISNGKCMAGDFCCQGCEHLGPQGCTVEALSCKLWLCSSAACTPDGARTMGQFRIIKGIAAEHGVPLYLRQSKEETFG